MDSRGLPPTPSLEFDREKRPFLSFIGFLLCQSREEIISFFRCILLYEIIERENGWTDGWVGVIGWVCTHCYYMFFYVFTCPFDLPTQTPRHFAFSRYSNITNIISENPYLVWWRFITTTKVIAGLYVSSSSLHASRIASNSCWRTWLNWMSLTPSR